MKTGDDIFRCRQCGDCCNGFGGTYVTDQDMAHICRYIKADKTTFKDRYCEKSGSRFVLATATNGTCIFFDPKKQCTIHPVKPYMCKAWPFIKTLIKNPENWDIMANSCPGMNKGTDHTMVQKIVKKEKCLLDGAVKG